MDFKHFINYNIYFDFNCLEKYTKEINGNNVKLTIKVNCQKKYIYLFIIKFFLKDVSIHDMGTYPFTVTVTSDAGKQESKQTELGKLAYV